MRTRSAVEKIPVVSYAEEVDHDEVAVDLHGYNDNSDESSRSSSKERQRSESHVQSTSVSSPRSTKGRGAPAEVKLYRGRNVGKLAMVLQMPVEVVCEIASHLEPIDVLHLARCSKPFNAMLMSKVSRRVWQMARSNVEALPDCPPDLSEPAYARLLFETDCHLCLAPRTMKPDYFLRVRLCRSCRELRVIRGGSLYLKIDGLTTQLLECVPCSETKIDVSRFCHDFYEPQVQKLVDEFYSIFPRGIREREMTEVLNDFYNEHRKRTSGIKRHAEDIQRWVSYRDALRREEGLVTMRQRRADVRAELIKLGYNEADFPNFWPIEDLEWSGIMNQHKPLTARIWQRVRPKLEAAIKRVRTRRVHERRRELLEMTLRPIIRQVISEREARDKRFYLPWFRALELPSVNTLIADFVADETQEINFDATRKRWDAAWVSIEEDMDRYAASC